MSEQTNVVYASGKGNVLVVAVVMFADNLSFFVWSVVFIYYCSIIIFNSLLWSIDCNDAVVLVNGINAWFIVGLVAVFIVIVPVNDLNLSHIIVFVLLSNVLFVIVWSLSDPTKLLYLHLVI